MAETGNTSQPVSRAIDSIAPSKTSTSLWRGALLCFFFLSVAFVALGSFYEFNSLSWVHGVVAGTGGPGRKAQLALSDLEGDNGNWKTPARPYVVASLSTITHRINALNRTIYSLLHQEPVGIVDEIVLSVPHFSLRYPTQDLNIPSYLNNLPRLTILRTEDYGPATKFIPTLMRETQLRRDSFIAIVDDDVAYPPNFVSSLLNYSLQHPGVAVALRGWCAAKSHNYFWAGDLYIHASQLAKPVRVDIMSGNNGIMIKPSLFTDLKALTHMPDKVKIQAQAQDDPWLSGVLASQGVERWIIPLEKDPKHFRDAYGLSGESVLSARDRNGAISDLLHYFGNNWTNCNIPDEVRNGKKEQTVCCLDLIQMPQLSMTKAGSNSSMDDARGSSRRFFSHHFFRKIFQQH